jgi:hypothetical protein
MKQALSPWSLSLAASLLLALTSASGATTISARRHNDTFGATPPPAVAQFLAQISEEDVAPTGVSGSGTVAPAAAPPAAVSDWEQVPANAGSGFGETKSAQGETTSVSIDQSATTASPAVAAPIATAPAIAATASAGVPNSNPSGPPAALDVSATTTAPDASDASLDGEIKTAGSPSLAASMRLTEEARKDLAAGKTDEAIRTLARAISIDPADPFEYFYLGRSYMARKNYAQAITFLKRAEIGLGARPEWYGAIEAYEGACYEVLGKTVEAARAYQRAVGAAPNNLMARVGYSRLAASLPQPANVPAAPPAEQAEAGPAGEATVPPPPVEPPPPPAAAADE